MGTATPPFFHFLQKVGKTQRVISSLNIDGTITTNKLVIKNHVINYYMKLFSESDDQNVDFSIIDDIISCFVTVDDNRNLTTTPSLEEIKHAMFAFDPSSSPGPDGFTGLFFQTCWDIIHKDLALAIHSFFFHGTITLSFNSNFMVLILKTPKASKIEHFHPISLGNFLYKIITKILANGLVVIASRIVSPNQFGVIQG